MVAQRYGISLLVLNLISLERAQQTLEEKFYISACPCIILYMYVSPVALGTYVLKRKHERT